MFFKKKNQQTSAELNAEIDDQLNAVIDQEKVLDFIVELSDTEYEKLIKVAKIYREANKKAGGIMNAGETETPLAVADQEFDKGLDAAFLETEPENKTVKVDVREVSDVIKS